MEMGKKVAIFNRERGQKSAPLVWQIKPCNLSLQAYDQKNIRRRVYDALNVLMAMNIISKEKKEIRWIGLPTNSAQECQNLEVRERVAIQNLFKHPISRCWQVKLLWALDKLETSYEHVLR